MFKPPLSVSCLQQRYRTVTDQSSPCTIIENRTPRIIVNKEQELNNDKHFSINRLECYFNLIAQYKTNQYGQKK